VKETERHIILFRDPALPRTLADWNAENEQIRSGWRFTGLQLKEKKSVISCFWTCMIFPAKKAGSCE